MEKLLSYLKSRTVLTVILMFLVNGVTGIQEFIPEAYLPIVNAVLSLLAIYYRVEARASFK